MSDNDKVIQTIFEVIEEINPGIPESRRLNKSPDTVLFGEGGSLDSLGLVNFIVTTEQKIQESFGVTVVLADEKAMSLRNSPFRTVQTLAEYVSVLLKERNNGHG